MLEKSSNLKQQNKKTVNKKYTNFNQILNIIYNEEINEIDSQIDEVNLGSIKIEPIFDSISDFEDGYAQVVQGSNSNYIDKYGKFIFKSKN